MKYTLVEYIRSYEDQPFVIVKSNVPNHWEVLGNDGNKSTFFYVTFNGNSKQRRQQRKKMLKELNQ